MKKQEKRGTIRSRIKRGDEVIFISGKEFNRFDSNGKRNPLTGKVIAVDPIKRKIKVEGAMIVKKHRKPNPQLNIEGGIIQMEAWVDVSNVAIADPKTGKPTRVGYEIRDGKKVRIAKGSGEVIPEPGMFARKEAAKAEAQKEEAEPKAESKPEEATEEKAAPKKKSKKKEEE